MQSTGGLQGAVAQSAMDPPPLRYSTNGVAAAGNGNRRASPSSSGGHFIFKAFDRSMETMSTFLFLSRRATASAVNVECERTRELSKKKKKDSNSRRALAMCPFTVVKPWASEGAGVMLEDINENLRRRPVRHASGANQRRRGLSGKARGGRDYEDPDSRKGHYNDHPN